MKRSDCVLGLIHTDLCKFPIQSRSHAKWMITFIDDASGFAALHFLRSKADAVTALQDLVSWAEAQTGYRVTISLFFSFYNARLMTRSRIGLTSHHPSWMPYA